jgi:hypothetical protein
MTLCNVYFTFVDQNPNVMITPSPSAAPKRTHGLFVAVVVWVLTYFVCRIILQKVGVAPLPGVVLSILPVLAFAFLVHRFIGSIASMDELERRMHLEAAVFGFTFSMALVMFLGLLDFSVRVNPDDWGHRHMVPYFVVFYFFGLWMARRKYR